MCVTALFLFCLSLLSLYGQLLPLKSVRSKLWDLLWDFYDFINPGKSIHPSMHASVILTLTTFTVEGCRGAGANHSCHWERGRVHPGHSQNDLHT